MTAQSPRKAREFWIELKNMCAWNMDEKPAPHRPVIHVREVIPDEIRVSRAMWDEMKSFLNKPEMTNRETALLNTMIQIERIERESCGG